MKRRPSPFGFRSPFGRTQGGAAPTALSIIQDNGGALFLPTSGSFYQDRSVTPSTAAAVGDPVGTWVGADGTYFAIAPSDGERMTLREDATGMLYLEGAQAANRMVVQNAAGVPLAPVGGVHTSCVGAYYTEAVGIPGWGYGSNSFRTSMTQGVLATSTSNIQVRNAATTNYLVFTRNQAAISRNVYTLIYKTDPVFWFNLNRYQATGAVFVENLDGFSIGSRETDVAALGAKRIYAAAFVPAALSEDDAIVIRDEIGIYTWTPTAPSDTNEVLLDFQNSIFEWGGVSRTLGDLTDNLDGTYTLDYMDWQGAGYLVSIDFNTPDDSVHGARTLLQMNSADMASSITQRIDTEVGQPYLVHRYAAFASGDTISKVAVGPGNLIPQEGVHRITLWVRPTQPYHSKASGYSWITSGSYPANYLDIWESMTILPNFTSGNILKIRAKGGVFTEAEADAFHETGAGFPVHMQGDSFVVFGEGSQAALQRVAGEQIGFLFVSGDGVGGATLPQHRDRFLAYTSASDLDRYNSTLVIEDGGWGQTDNAADIAAIQDMVDALTHSRWLYLEPWYDSGQGSATTNGINFRAGQAVIKAAFPSNYVETTRHAQAAHNDTAQSLADVAAGLIPSGAGDLRVDSVHPRTPQGYTLRNRVTLAALARRGWVTGITLSAPGAPTNFAESSLALSWDLPADEGNDPVYEFTVYVEDSPGAGTFTSVYTGQLRRHTLTGLTTGTWKVRVVATNETGTGTHAEIEVTV